MPPTTERLSTDIEPVYQPIDDRMADPKELVPPGGNPWDDMPAVIDAKDTANHPDVKRPELIEMEKWWWLGDVLLNGTEAIVAHASQLLPPLGDDEQPAERDARLRKACNTPFYEDHLSRLVARPFGRPVTFKGGDGKLPESLQHLMVNADGEGRSLSSLMREDMADAIHRGGSCLLVDLPTTEGADSAGKELELRPLIKRESLRNILGWDYEWDNSNVDGKGAKMITTMLRLREDKHVKSGQWGTTCVEGIRVIRAHRPPAMQGFSIRYEKQTNGDWKIVQAAKFTLNRIMIHPTWTRQTGATSARSPMTHLAELNMAYIVDDTEQRYGTSYARISTLWTAALDDEEKKAGSLSKNIMEQGMVRTPPKRITRGHRRHIRLPQDAQVGMLESSGSGLAAGRAELDNLEKRMERFGASHVSTAGVTATSIRSDDDRDTSNLRAWCTREEESAEAAIRDCAELNRTVLPSDFAVQLFRDWSQATERDEAAARVFEAWDRTLVPARVVYTQLRRYGAIGPNDNDEDLLQEAREEAEDAGTSEAEDEMARAVAEAAAAAGGGGAPPKPPPDDGTKPPGPKPPARNGKPTTRPFG